MRLAAAERGEIRAGKLIERQSPLADTSTLGKSAKLSSRVDELIVEGYCRECNRMATVPQGAFAVLQVRKNSERPFPAKFYHEQEKETKDSKNVGFNAKVLQEGRELTPLKYNSKLMNSIWGLYNRYSVHNFKKIDANEAGLLAWGLNPAEATASKAPVVSAGH
ncbi:uncharacterized protein LOC131664546 [Phymastichus coffea]|uniref:uncharacterized protein LOC131664546 n=1 Tax=Phymastichus coffea TaxID=108790 RepID=UPI00273C7C68|nr:uncharacterized protein LOC131664546 [Phymastichus coffea]XP_058791720.1 uncharacterized protein LOC131664546 [Phymastichus coffea]XP_058791721.1 uncharacterized protein LOC131664546 [Phymastichus coffea]XP_058791722.1 uncharacterized protein LOC131664546 [Phymastichus coffea]